MKITNNTTDIHMSLNHHKFIEQTIEFMKTKPSVFSVKRVKELERAYQEYLKNSNGKSTIVTKENHSILLKASLLGDEYKRMLKDNKNKSK